MDGSKEDNQVSCTRKPYWGAAKKACSVNQYGAPPMDGSKNGQAEVPTAAAASKGLAAPTTVPAGVPMAAAVSKEPAAPMVGLAGRSHQLR